MIPRGLFQKSSGMFSSGFILSTIHLHQPLPVASVNATQLLTRHPIGPVALGNAVASGIILLLSVFFAPYIDYIILAIAAIATIALIVLIVKIALHNPTNENNAKTE